MTDDLLPAADNQLPAASNQPPTSSLTVWEVYLILLSRLGFRSTTHAPESGGGDLPASTELPPIQWVLSLGDIQVNPWLYVGVPLALVFALAGQLTLTGSQMVWVGVSALVLGAGVLVVETRRLRLDWRRPAETKVFLVQDVPLPGMQAEQATPIVRWRFVIAAYVFTALTFIFSGGNNFNPLAQLCWVGSLVSWVLGFWDGPLFDAARLHAWLADPLPARLSLNVSRTGLILVAIMALSAVFRFSQLDTVPIAMTSDHVEKLLDVNDILVNGKRPIFEPSNGGREPLEFYLAAFTAWAFNTGLSHLTLKLVTSVAGFIAIPIIFLLAREIAQDDTVGLLAALMAGLGWWPNVISRNGLRFPFAMLFSALTLWLVIRALRRNSSNSVLLAGVALGVGLYGYTPIRIVPVAVGLAFSLFALHHRTRPAVFRAIASFAIFAMIAFAAFMPMIRYAVDEPENFWRRTATRITGEPGLETAQLNWRALSCDYDQVPRPPQNGLEQSALTGWVFLCNESNSLRMFQWTSDSAWLISPAATPALDWVMGALFFLGVAITIYRYIRYRDWLDLFLLLALPVLLLPSTLALAFPIENPSLHRSAAAIPIVFVIVAIPLRLLLDYGRKTIGGWLGGALAVGFIALLTLISAQQNWTILFVRYAEQYKSSVQNSPELGHDVRDWAGSIGDWSTVVIKAYPYWVDTRAVGYEAGQPGWNNVALELDVLDDLALDPRPKLYILHRNDTEAIRFLRQIYPQGTLSYRKSEYHDKDYLHFFVPGTVDFDEGLLTAP